MENDTSWEQKALINELTQGMETARKLKADLTLPSSVDTRDLLVQKILSSYDKALLILRWNASISMSTKTSSPESPVSFNRGGLKNHQKAKQDSKKRKMMPKWMDQVKVKIENGIEGPYEDGYSWRKYGQKDILGAKYPRNYYRCTFRNTKGCMATKQLQRSDKDPTILDITYRGSHTCSQRNDAVLPPKSPEPQEKAHGQESLTKLKNTLTVNTENLENEETAYPFTSLECMTQDNHTLFPSMLQENYDPFLSSISQTHLLSPETPESKYYLSLDELDGVPTKPGPAGSDIISADTLAANSPIFDFNFSLDSVNIDPNFPFNTSGFLS
ncbi:WRKY domain [Sesbania bispinosa]|nr:WRKY domain [Sesbania bispinosa]